ncbi:putative MFS family arabinose efflux permease [Streptomyces puniciscabiei]|uniref:Putative MFS family arabinose efflux permease n=1 Tax=Streptomyces puniciscabiei TaxID=164348 RepID=A0A542TJ60_9ACTN|nr:MFS transporter [Streptomyces puniciscabiei]TQK86866.1 putative MFS family arabinose efflux permease [Streptomyces puniciscabiei]
MSVPASLALPTAPRRVILVLALACGVSVSTIYFPQAISSLIATDLDIPAGSASLVVTAAQFGYAGGIFLLVPLGDRLPSRRLIVTLLALTAAGLVVAGAAPTLPVLVAASAAIGVTTVVPQIIIPMAAGLVPPERRGAVTGTLLSGLIGGILLARTFGGTLGEWLGWRAPYLVAAALVLALAGTLARVVPDTTPSSGHRYATLISAPLRLLREEPDLRRSCLYQATVFAGFSAAWTALTLLVTGPAYGRGAQAVGVLGLVGAASMFCTPLAGRAADRRGPDTVSLWCLLGVIGSAGVLALAGLGGTAGLIVLAGGMLLLDVAVQSGQVANQARNLALRPDARARVNTAYMTCAFLGGSAGSWLGIRAYDRLGWPGVTGLVALSAVIALTRHLTHLARRRTAVGPVEGTVTPSRVP